MPPRGNPHPRTDHIEKFRFKEGNPGGPGRPKTPYTDAHRAIAKKLVKDLGIKQTDTVAIGVAKAVAKEALKGKIPAAKEATDRIEGTPTQRIEHGGIDGESVKIEATIGPADLVEALRKIYGLGSRRKSGKSS